MKKTLIGSSRIDEFIKEGETTFYMDKTMILTSGAKDILRDRGVVIEYGPRPAAEEPAPVSCAKAAEETAPVSCTEAVEAPEDESIESLMDTFTALLKNDPEAIREISRIVLEKIKEN